jgi:hypothetical protein
MADALYHGSELGVFADEGAEVSVAPKVSPLPDSFFDTISKHCVTSGPSEQELDEFFGRLSGRLP